MTDRNDDAKSRPGLFSTTHWTVVVEAGDQDSPGAKAALESLCDTYWYPLYAFARGLGRSPEAAEDLVQSFFVQLIEKNSVRVADRDRGRFRTFLLTAFKRFITNDWNRERAQKRGGGVKPISLDPVAGEERMGRDVAATDTPELAYEKRWAGTLIEKARNALEQEFIAAGKGDRFTALEPHLVGDPSAMTYAHLAKQFGITEGGVKAEAHRLRQRYRNQLRAEVAKTVLHQEEVGDEIAYLMEVLSR